LGPARGWAEPAGGGKGAEWPVGSRGLGLSRRKGGTDMERRAASEGRQFAGRVGKTRQFVGKHWARAGRAQRGWARLASSWRAFWKASYGGGAFWGDGDVDEGILMFPDMFRNIYIPTPQRKGGAPSGCKRYISVRWAYFDPLASW
jgi:hypothetical protein